MGLSSDLNHDRNITLHISDLTVEWRLHPFKIIITAIPLEGTDRLPDSVYQLLQAYVFSWEGDAIQRFPWVLARGECPPAELRLYQMMKKAKKKMTKEFPGATVEEEFWSRR